MRSWKLHKTRAGKPKVTLYEHGQVMLSRPVTTSAQGANLGRAWADSDEPTCGIRVESKGSAG